MTIPEHQVLDVSGSAVHAWTSDPAGAEHPDRPVLLALHGWSDDGAVFGPLAHRLADRCDVYAPDAPGHGRTAWDRPGRFTYDALVEPAAEVLRHVAGLAHGRPVILFGHSMGANLAVTLASRHAASIDRLVIEEPAHLPRIALMERFKDIRWRRRLQAAGHEASVAEIQRIAPWPRDEAEAWADALGRADLAVLGTMRDYRPLLDLLEVTVTVPATVVIGGGGERPRAADVALQRCLAACTGPTEVVRVGDGHNPRREDPEAFDRALDEVLRTARAGGAGPVS